MQIERVLHPFWLGGDHVGVAAGPDLHLAEAQGGNRPHAGRGRHLAEVPSDTTTGAIKVCKIAGSGVTVGTNFTFTVGGRTVTVPAGPASQGGTCKIVGGFTRGSNVTVTEAAKAGTHVSSIKVQPLDRQVSKSTANRTATVKVARTLTVVTFTNAANPV